MTCASQTAIITPLIGRAVAQMRAQLGQAAAAGADLAELRLDYLQPPCTPEALAALLASRPLPVIVTCRPVRQGGLWEGDEIARLALLAEAARLGAEYIDLEADAAEFLPRLRAGSSMGVPPMSSTAVPAVDQVKTNRHGQDAHATHGQDARATTRILVSHHDFQGVPADLPGLAARLAALGGDVVKVAFTAAGPEDALAALNLVEQCPQPMIALAMGEAGLASRVLARKFGGFGTFAALAADAQSAPGQPTVAELRQLYRWDSMNAETAVYGVIGCPIAHSLSPALHNAAFAAAGLNAVYLPLRVEPGPAAFNRFLDAALACPQAGVRGLSVTIPHKEHALARVGPANVDELSRQIGAINTIRLEPDGSLRGWNTDYAAAIDALCAAMHITRAGLAGRSAAVLGAGGAARAIVAALRHYGAEVTIYNRTLERAEKLAAEFSARAAELVGLAELSEEIVINCTAVGMSPRGHECPVPEAALAGAAVVFDTIYNPPDTLLLQAARRHGCLTVSGLDMFLNQAGAQFELWTGQPAPVQVMRSDSASEDFFIHKG